MELNHLKYFHTVAREGSFTRASNVLRIQQPTISKMVKNLESQLGITLFERHKSGIRLTEAGTEVFRVCAEIFRQVDDIRGISNPAKPECVGPLTFGATDSVVSYLVPNVLGEFLRIHPQVKPSIFAGSSNLMWNEIMDGRVEFGIVFTFPHHSALEISELGLVPFHLVIAADRARSNPLRNDFIISREIDYPKARPFPVLEMLRKNRVRVNTTIACNNLDAQKQMVKQGLGVALLPRFMVKNGIRKHTLTPLHSKKHFNYSLKLVHRKGRVLSKNSKAFIEKFTEMLPALV